MKDAHARTHTYNITSNVGPQININKCSCVNDNESMSSHDVIIHTFSPEFDREPTGSYIAPQ